jgi:hypothetical protein
MASNEANEEKRAEPATYTIGGLEVYVHGLSSTGKTKGPRTVLFLLHGRLSTHAEFDPLIAKFDLAKINALAKRRQL